MRICHKSICFGLLVPALIVPAPMNACSKLGFLGIRSAREAHFVGIPKPDSVLAGAGTVKYIVAPGHFGPQGERSIFGQIVRVERIGGLASRLLDANVSDVVVVPWDYAADCTPTPWNRSSAWMTPNEQGLVTATLRDSAYWANGLPTFDVSTPNMQPYPQRAAQQMRRRNVPADTLMSMEDVFLLMEILPEENELADSAEQAVEPLFNWARTNPAIARRYPAAAALTRARFAITNARLRRIRSPFVGTYRFTFRVGGGVERSFYARTRPIPSSHWSHRREPAQFDDPTIVVRPSGYYLQATGAVNASELPIACPDNADPKNYRDGYIAVLEEPPVRIVDGLQWLGKVEIDLLRRVFAEDAELNQFIKDEFQRFHDRRTQGLPYDTPARFTQTQSGSIRVEQTITLDDGRTIVINGDHVSSATLSCDRR